MTSSFNLSLLAQPKLELIPILQQDVNGVHDHTWPSRIVVLLTDRERHVSLGLLDIGLVLLRCFFLVVFLPFRILFVFRVRCFQPRIYLRLENLLHFFKA